MNRFSRKTLLIFGIIMATLAAWFLWRFFTQVPGGEETVPPSFPIAKTETQRPPAQEVPDVAEPRERTDPERPDTDGDGVPDREELNRLRRAQEEPIELERPASPASKILSSPTLPSQQGAAEPPAAPHEPAPALPRPSPPQFPRPETIALRAYAATAGTVIETYASRWKTEVDAFEAFATTSASASAKAALERTADDYRARAAALSQIAAPEKVHTLHQALVSRYRAQADAIEMIASRGAFEHTSKEDWNVYGAAVVAAGRAYVSLAQFLSEENAAFLRASF
ncbi:MAG: hypothetical protein Greene041679_93 [Parcubacteria group bacterium Greene0416_79]|nr:MAG: hypothetical protein Greene041679_93 [Parcubacteria group bacterium Greene0416_79]